MNILLSAYSFGAGRGSEAGVGWNVARGMALRGHLVTVITTREFSASNRAAIQAEGLNINLIEEDCGISFYPSSRSYRKWQRRIGSTIRQVATDGNCDLIHHVTFNQYRDIHDVFATHLPYLIGPVGGAELVPRPLLQYGNLPLLNRIKEWLRYSSLDAIPLTHRCCRHRARGILLASNAPTAERLHKLPVQTSICPAIALHDSEIVEHLESPGNHEPYILFDGGLSRPQKGTWLALRALSRLWSQDRCVPIRMVGISPADQEIIRNYVQQVNLPEGAVQLEAQVSRATMLRYMQEASIMLSCVYRDSGSMALLEALAQGCRIVCLDIPSQAWLPPHFCHKVAIEATSEVMESAIAAALSCELEAPQRTQQWQAERVQWLRNHMTWETRISNLESYYKQLIV